MKNILKIILVFFILSLGFSSVFAGNLDTRGQGDNGEDRIKKLNEIANGENGDKFFDTGALGERGINNLFINIARDAKNVIFIIATIIMFVLVFRLLVGDNGEEEIDKFKKGIIWIALGIIVMQISFVFYQVIFDKGADTSTAVRLSESILEPFTKLLMMGASFVFIAVAIFAFYKIVTANGDEEAVSKGKMSIFYGLIGFIVIKMADVLVKSTYGKLKCKSSDLFTLNPSNCIEQPKIEGVMGILSTLINWINSFLGIVIIILIIYAGFLVMTGAGDEEKNKKAKSIIFYAFIGLLVLVMSYLLLTFFIIPETPISE